MADVNELVSSIAEKQAEQRKLILMFGEAHRIQELWPEAFAAGKCGLRSRESWATGSRQFKIMERELRRADGETKQITEDEYKYIMGDSYIPLRPQVRPRNNIN